MSEAMDHDDPGPGINPAPNPTVATLGQAWSDEPFDGPPSTTFAIATTTGSTIIGPPTETLRGSPRDTIEQPRTGGGTISPIPTPREYIVTYDHRILVTDLLLIGFIPDDILHLDFCDTMDRIQRHLKVPRINNYYHDAAFASKFASTGASSWADDGFSYPEEKHNSFLLRLGGQLPFTFAGHPSEQQRPMVFTIPASPVHDNRPNRWLVVQPVPTNFIELFLRPPIAVWRGVGNDASLGHAGAALLLVTLYVTQAAETWRTEDRDCAWNTYSFLSTHKVDIKPPPKSTRPPPPDPRRQDRNRGRYGRPMSRDTGGTAAPPQPPEPEGQTQAQYSEVFVITVCTAPIGMHTRCFESLIPPQAAFGLPLYPLRLCGWWLEMARGIDIFRTNERRVGPGLALLTPRPTLRIKGIKAGATLGRIVEALGTEGQVATGILAGFIHRPPGGDTCTLIVDGPRLLGTMALRPLASSLTPVEEEDLEDLRKLRDRYGVFRRSLGLSTTSDPSPAIQTTLPVGELSLIVRSSRAGPAPTFSEIVRALPSGAGDQLRTWVTEAIQQEVAVATRQALTQVGELVAAHRLLEETAQHQATAIAGLEAKQADQGDSILVLEATQETLRDEVTESRAAIDATAATVREHTRDWTDLRTFLTQQTAQLTRIEDRMELNQSSIQSLFKRRGGDVDEEDRSSPPAPGSTTQR